MVESNSILQIGQRLSDDDSGGGGGGGGGGIDEVSGSEGGIEDLFSGGGIEELSYSEGSSVRI